MDGQSAQARFDRFERVQDGQARSRKDSKWRKEFEKSRQLLSDQIIATASLPQRPCQSYCNGLWQINIV
ncbi:MAG: hypothetical protein EBZ48_01220 [Proteobacteria bacterium]|nr:hypothetical protein [Pseudomonadota bacterium]